MLQLRRCSRPKQLHILQLQAYGVVRMLDVYQRHIFMDKDHFVHSCRHQGAASGVYCKPRQTEESLRRSTSCWYRKHHPRQLRHSTVWDMSAVETPTRPECYRVKLIGTETAVSCEILSGLTTHVSEEAHV